MDRLVNRLVSICLQKGYISEKQAPWLRYALSKRIAFFIVVIPFLLLGVCISTFEAASAFLLSFYFLRERTGGYHANNPWVCLLISLFLEFLFLGVLSKFSSHSINAFSTLISVIFIFNYAPFRCPRMNLSEEEVMVCGHSAKIRAIILVVIGILCGFLGFGEAASGVSLGIAMAACGLAIAYIKQKGEI